MRRSALLIAPALLLAGLVGCNGEADVPSGTYEGVVQEVESDPQEIYVERDDGKVLELYFTNQTGLTRGGESADFSELSEGQRVRVEVQRRDEGLVPLSVDILEAQQAADEPNQQEPNDPNMPLVE